MKRTSKTDQSHSRTNLLYSSQDLLSTWIWLHYTLYGFPYYPRKNVLYNSYNFHPVYPSSSYETSNPCAIGCAATSICTTDSALFFLILSSLSSIRCTLIWYLISDFDLISFRINFPQCRLTKIMARAVRVPSVATVEYSNTPQSVGSSGHWPPAPAPTSGHWHTSSSSTSSLIFDQETSRHSDSLSSASEPSLTLQS